MDGKHVALGGCLFASLLVIVSPARGALPFSDDFSDNSAWTNHGTDAVTIDTDAGVVTAHGAVDWSPPSRLTLPESTGMDDFDVQFDIRRTGYNGSGALWIGWVNVDEYASVQDHSNYQQLYSWESHDQNGNPSSGLFVQLDSGSGDAGTAPHRSFYQCSRNGSLQDLVSYDTGPMTTGTWHTLNFGRSGTTGYLDILNRDTGVSILGAPLTIDLGDIVGYSYFHISSIDGMSNNWWVDHEIDNIFLTPEPTAAALMALGGVAAIRRRRQTNHDSSRSSFTPVTSRDGSL